MDEYLQPRNRTESHGFLQAPALSESLQCQRTGRTPVICDAWTCQQSLECSSHSDGGDKPHRAEAAAAAPPCWATPTSHCFPSTYRCGRLFSQTPAESDWNAGTTRCQQKKVHGHGSHPENLSLASQHPPTQSYQAPLHTPRILTALLKMTYLCELNL